MKRFIVILLTVTFGFTVNGQNLERKIIVEKGKYYYVTVDDNYQLGTLYTGELTAPLSESKAMALPVGRGVSSQINPLAWDIFGGDMYAINFLDHSLNDRNEAIKRFSLSGLRAWSEGVEIGEMIMQSVDQNMYVLNEPYLFAKERSNYLNHFYFDAVVKDGAYWMVMTNNGELVVWKYEDEVWAHGEVKMFKVNGHFHLMAYEDGLLFVNTNGEVYEIGLNEMNQIQLKNNSLNLLEITLIEDRDSNKVYYIKNGHFNRDKSLKEIIEIAAIEFIKE